MCLLSLNKVIDSFHCQSNLNFCFFLCDPVAICMLFLVELTSNRKSLPKFVTRIMGLCQAKINRENTEYTPPGTPESSTVKPQRSVPSIPTTPATQSTHPTSSRTGLSSNVATTESTTPDTPLPHPAITPGSPDTPQPPYNTHNPANSSLYVERHISNDNEHKSKLRQIFSLNPSNKGKSHSSAKIMSVNSINSFGIGSKPNLQDRIGVESNSIIDNQRQISIQSPTDYPIKSPVEHAINWSIRLSDNPLPENDDDEETHHQSTGTFVKYASETAYSQFSDFPTTTNRSPFGTPLMNANNNTSQKNGVYIIGRDSTNNNGVGTFIPHSKPNMTMTMSLEDILPINGLKGIDNIICGNGYDILCDYDNDKIYGIGRNNYGQCGVGNFDATLGIKQEITLFKQNGIGIKKICASVTGESTFWISEKNEIFGCGRNNKNQLGLSIEYDQQNVNIPTKVNDLNGIVDIKCAYNYSLALGVKYVGDVIENWYRLNQSGINVLIDADIITVISAFHGWSVYSTEFSLYGGNGHGLNDKNIENRESWKEIRAFANVDIIKIESGYYHSLFLDSNGVLWSCGDNDNGQCGRDETYDTSIPKPIEYFVNNNIKIIDIKCGYSHNLAIDEDNKLWSWGLNKFGQCGDGTLNTCFKPKLISTFKYEKIKQIDCGSYHSFALTMDNKYYLWGSNKYFECAVFGQEKVKIPTEIDLKRIDDIFLGDRDTKWIVRGNDGDNDIIEEVVELNDASSELNLKKIPSSTYSRTVVIHDR